MAFIRRVLSSHSEIERAILFGSRAKGTNKPGSDIDLALVGKDLATQTLNHLYQELDDLPVPYEFDLLILAQIQDPDVIAHIGRVGITFYEKESALSKS